VEPCPDDDAVAAFLDGALDADEAAAIVAHMAGCAPCRRLFSSVARVLPEDQGSGSEPPAALPPGSLTPAGPADLIGRRLGNFTVSGFVGAGAMGAVFLAEHALLGHRVAIKVMQLDRLGPAAQKEATARFITEARALTEIDDLTHVIRLLDFGEVTLEAGSGSAAPGGHIYYYAMEYLEGHTLEKELTYRRRLEPAAALGHLSQICAGLEAAHRCRILHRDLKPANIFVCAGEPPRLKLLDFGLAKRLAEHQPLTLGGMGTPLYAAPELVRGDTSRVGPATDVYSVGVIAYRMLAGLFPFDIPPGVSARELFLLPTRTTPVPLAVRCPQVPPALARVVDRAIDPEPTLRPASAQALRLALEAALPGGEAVEVSQAGPAAAGGSIDALPTLAAPAPGPGPAPASQADAQAEPASAPPWATAVGRIDVAADAFEPPAGPSRPAPRRRERSLALTAGLLGTGLLGAVALGFWALSSITAPLQRGSGGADGGSGPPPVQVANLLRATGATVTVSSTVRNRNDLPAHLVDGSFETAWSSRSGELAGAWIAFDLPREAHVEAIQLTAGFTRVTPRRDLFRGNHRLTRVRVTRDGRELGVFRIDPERIDLQNLPVDGPGGSFRLEVVETLPGTRRRWREVCISELRVSGHLPAGTRILDATPEVRVHAADPPAAPEPDAP
jgi:serine/threonine-protein kinase